MTSIEQDPTPPSPLAAATAARDLRFIDAIGVALMTVLVEGPPDIGPPGQNMVRHIAANPAAEAQRWAFAMASDPQIVAAAQQADKAGDGGTSVDGMALLVAKARSLWSVMAGEPEPVDHRFSDTRNTGKGG